MKIFSQLKITSDELTPQEIDSHIGILSDRGWLKGDFRKNTAIKEKKNG